MLEAAGGRDLPPIGVELAKEVVRLARAAGAESGDALIYEETSFEAISRGQEVESVQRATERRIGLRVFTAGGRSACASTADLTRASVQKAVEAAVALARESSEDPSAGLPSEGCLVEHPIDLDLLDREGASLDPGAKVAATLRAEAASRAADSRITNSEGTRYSDELVHLAFANSNGAAGEYRATRFSLASMPVASQGEDKQTSFWFTAGRKLSGLESPEAVGEKAARKAAARLGSRKVATCRVPVVFDSETASGLLRSLASACSGSLLVAGSSFLVGKLGTRIAADGVTVVDDPSLRGALGSRPFDAEGMPSRRTTVIEKGTLASYLLDSYTSRKLGLATTGNAWARPGEAMGVAPTNFLLLPGPSSPKEILRGVEEGLLVTELIGFGVNLVTGDYSRGAAGFWVRGGEIVHPVHEVTIAGNLKEMLLAIEIVGNDLPPNRAVASPTLRISGLTVAGG